MKPKSAEVLDAERRLGKPLDQLTYADIIRMERPEPRGLQKVTRDDLQILDPVATTASRTVATTASQIDVASVASVASHTPNDSRRRQPKRTDFEQLNMRLPYDLIDAVRRWCFENRVSMKDFVAEALRAKLKRSASQDSVASQDSHGSQLATYDDDIDIDDEGPLVQLYETLTGNSFTANDRACLRENKPLGPDCIQLALLLGRSRYRGKQINSFRFFDKIIREVAAWTPDKIRDELQFQQVMFRRKVRR
jgi:hypothetical protein